jgi:aspartyl aminopeptidase
MMEAYMGNDLLNIRENGFKDIDEIEKDEIEEFCNKYKSFLNESKTEREVINNIKLLAIENGFKNIDDFKKLTPGDKIYYVNKEKNIFLAIIGKEDIDNGLNIIVSHADSPRLDLKPNPLYEEEGFAYLKTHYYGVIKKYQWTTIPLSLHGVIVKTDGERINICIGEKDDDPIFTISDLLPHLANEQMEKKLKDGIEGEALNLVVGNIPYNDKCNNNIKINILKILKEKYNFSETDFISSEIEAVPAFKPRDLGFDRSMITGYGQDDKLSVFTSIYGLLDSTNLKRTSICVVSDKEEIGSLGNTSVNTNTFDFFITAIYEKIKENKLLLLDQIYNNSRMICADVDVAFDPIYESVFEKNNASYLGKGLTLSKYSGSKGKNECSDANAEFVAFIRNIFEKNNIRYQSGEVGKVDAGGGGTIAYVFANKGIEVIDCGVAILSMHSPLEIASKYDIHTSYKAYKYFFESF